MRLNRLTLNNFKGIRSFTLEPQGEDVNIYGDNAVGKTTIFDAFTWLLFGKDSLNRADFEIKTLGPDGEPEHGLEHTVEAILELDDRQQIALKKVFREKWQKKRGSATAEFTGHTTDHFIDGIPVKKKEYDEKIAEIADEEIFRLLTDPTYFNQQLHWQKRRELLLEICGDVSDVEVIANKAELSKLADILGNRTLDQHRKVIQARRTEINKELEKIPVRIDEVKLGLPDISDITNEKELPNDIAKLREQLRAKQEELAQAKAGGQIAEKTKELRLIEAQIMDLKNKHRQMLDKKVGNKSRELSYAQSEIYKLKANINAKSDTIKYNETSIKSLDEKMENLRNKWHEENAKAFEFAQSDTCPTCGQALPAEQLESAREKALADFNRKKAEKLEAINEEGKSLKAMQTAAEIKVLETKHELERNNEELAELEKNEAALKAEIDNIMQEAEPVESTPEYAKLSKQIEAIRAEIQELEVDNKEAVIIIQKEIDVISEDIEALEKTAAKLEAYYKGLGRIDELAAEERKLAAEFEELEQQLYLTEEFIRTKVRLLEEKINSKFKMARFKLFDVQVNGALAETAETMYNGVPYSNLNNGARINVGLDIIRTLAKHYNFYPPIFIDNRESITELIDVSPQQTISLIVSEKDQKLRVELKEEVKEAIA